MSRTGFVISAALLLAAFIPQDAGAQGRDRDRDRDRDVWDVIVGRPVETGNDRGGGPPFCANGQGHPVHGIDWCYRKGFGVGRSGGLGDIIFRSPRREGRLSQGGLLDVLGSVVYGQLQERSRAMGTGAPLIGSWYAAPGGGHLLSVRSGDLIIAELIDRTLDGRVDLYRLRREW